MLKISEPSLRVLNDGSCDKMKAKSAVDVSKELQKLMLRMKGEYMLESGDGVRYEALRQSDLFKQYVDEARGLQLVDLGTLSEVQKMAFFMNIYNSLTIHGLSGCAELPDSVLKVQLFWKKTAYNIGGHVFSLDDIEHGVLRGNRPHPAATQPQFAPTDPRVKYIMKTVDPRIHFALVCGAKSCPSIRVYTPENLQKALDGATRSFCEQEVKVYEMRKEIKVSKIFQWYRSDFGINDVEAVRWTLPFLDAEKQRILRSLLRLLEHEGMVDLAYNNYNWDLNKA